MQIQTVDIKNFRCFENFSVSLANITILVGENGIGKTALLAAIDKVIGPGRTYFVEEDFYKADAEGDPRSSMPIQIELTLVPSNGATDFSPEENGAFGYDFDVRPDGTVRLVIRAQHYFDVDEGDYKTQVSFVKEGNVQSPFRAKHKETLCFFLAQSLRDVERDVLGRRGLLSQLLDSIDLDAPTSQQVEELSRGIDAAIAADPRIAVFRSELLTWISRILPLAGGDSAISLRPLPFRPDEVLRNSSLLIQMAGQATAYPIAAQGSGTQSLLVLALFDSYTRTVGLSAPILGVEEPEAHLHPHLQRFALSYFKQRGAQVILSTHSTFITDRADPYSIRVLRRQPSGIAAKQIPYMKGGARFLSEKEEKQLASCLDASGSEILFSKAVVLVEGASERLAYPVFASSLGMDLDRAGVSIIGYQGDDFGLLGKVLGADALGIPYVVQPDGEQTTIAKAVRRLVALGRADRARAVTFKTDLFGSVREILLPNKCVSSVGRRDRSGFRL